MANLSYGCIKQVWLRNIFAYYEYWKKAFESTYPNGYWSGDVNGSSGAEGLCSFMKNEGKNKCSWFYSFLHI